VVIPAAMVMLMDEHIVIQYARIHDTLSLFKLKICTSKSFNEKSSQPGFTELLQLSVIRNMNYARDKLREI
jgi:hypothetical protein